MRPRDTPRPAPRRSHNLRRACVTNAGATAIERERLVGLFSIVARIGLGSLFSMSKIEKAARDPLRARTRFARPRAGRYSPGASKDGRVERGVGSIRYPLPCIQRTDGEDVVVVIVFLHLGANGGGERAGLARRVPSDGGGEGAHAGAGGGGEGGESGGAVAGHREAHEEAGWWRVGCWLRARETMKGEREGTLAFFFLGRSCDERVSAAERCLLRSAVAAPLNLYMFFIERLSGAN